MAYTVNPYLLDLSTLRHACGHGSPDLINPILQANAVLLQQNSTYLELAFGPNALNLTTALQELLTGQCRPSEPLLSQYINALQYTCRYLGTRLPNSPFDGCSLDFIHLCIPPSLLHSGPPVPIPTSDDIPLACFHPLGVPFTPQTTLPSELYPRAHQDIQAGRQQVHHWIQYAHTKNTDLILFIG